jgi:hypothetical protein
LTACFGTCENASAAAKSASVGWLGLPVFRSLICFSAERHEGLSLEKADQILRHLPLDLLDLRKSED